MPPSREFREQLFTQQLRQASHVTYSVGMLGELPGAMVRTTDPYAAIACLEAFLVHARLMIEFLLVCPANSKKDFSAKDFGWSGEPNADVDQLKAVWVLASRHLVHFSRDRAPESMYDLEVVDTSAAGLRTIADAILALFEIFVADVESREGEDALAFRHSLDEARNKLAVIPDASE